jgi:hypothetical protein
MKDSYGESVARRTNPESCVAGREARHEALAGARAGRYRPRNQDTCEVPKQRWGAFTSGGHGGKTTNQGELGAAGCDPDAKLGERVRWAAQPCAGSSKGGGNDYDSPRYCTTSLSRKQLLRA